MTHYDNRWVLEEHIESLERMLNATLHQLKQSKDNLKNLKELVRESEEIESANGGEP